MRALTAACLVAGFALSPPHAAAAQTAAPAGASPPGAITAAERVEWVVRGNASPQSLAAGVFLGGWNTASASGISIAKRTSPCRMAWKRRSARRGARIRAISGRRGLGPTLA